MRRCGSHGRRQLQGRSAGRRLAERTTTQAGERTTPKKGGARRARRRIYRVKLNDTLGLIAEKTGVPVERLQELNPELDAQNLVVGQRVKLRQ